MEKVYGLEIAPEKIAKFNEILSKNPLLETIFGREWIKTQIFDFYCNKAKIHPLFWFILRDIELVRKLELLKKSYTKFPNLIKSLKKDVDNIESVMETINIFYEYSLKHQEVYFQPENKEANKECDLMVVIEGVQCWGEVLTINFDKKDTSQNSLHSFLSDQFNELNTTNNCVFIQSIESFDENIKEKLLQFLLEEASKLSLKKDGIVTKEFIENGTVICTVDFFGKGDAYDKGYYGGDMTPVRYMKEDMRVKNKIFDKLDKFQFPSTKDIKRFIILVLKGNIDTIDVDNALFGQECVIFNSRDGSHKEGRQQNGIIHDLKRAEKLGEIDFIMFTDDGRKIFRINEKSQLNLDFVKANF